MSLCRVPLIVVQPLILALCTLRFVPRMQIIKVLLEVGRKLDNCLEVGISDNDLPIFILFGVEFGQGDRGLESCR